MELCISETVLFHVFVALSPPELIYFNNTLEAAKVLAEFILLCY